MKNNSITVNELSKVLQSLIDKNYGDYTINLESSKEDGSFKCYLMKNEEKIKFEVH